MSSEIDCSPSSELFEEILLCARYGEVEDLTEYFEKLPAQVVDTLIRQQDSRGNTALHFCAANGHLSVVKLLFSRQKAAIDLRNEGGNTALHWACLNGHDKTVKYLVDSGADVKIKNKGGRMPIDEAESQGKESIVLWLLALDMKREKEAGELPADGDAEEDEGNVSINVSAGETSDLVDADASSTNGSSSEHERLANKVDQMDMLD